MLFLAAENFSSHFLVRKHTSLKRKMFAPTVRDCYLPSSTLF
jgi:hypothetical protein